MSQSLCPGILQVAGLPLVLRVPRDAMEAESDSSEGTRRPNPRTGAEPEVPRDTSDSGKDSSEGTRRVGPRVGGGAQSKKPSP